MHDAMSGPCRDFGLRPGPIMLPGPVTLIPGKTSRGICFARGLQDCRALYSYPIT